MSRAEDRCREYVINNAQAGYPKRQVSVPVPRASLERLAETGYLVLSGLFDPQTLAGFGAALEAVAEREATVTDPHHEGQRGSLYLRWLLTKDRRFFPFNAHPTLVGVARAMLGPQIRLDDADARITVPGAPNGTGWHIHLRIVPDPMPTFFCYPHALHHLLYLDEVGEREGGLCVLPGSHRQPTLRIGKGDTEDRPRQEVLYPRAGDVVLLHANLWHRAMPSHDGARSRRLMLGTFSPCWLNDTYDVGTRGPIDWRAEYLAAASGDADRELAGVFSWV